MKHSISDYLKGFKFSIEWSIQLQCAVFVSILLHVLFFFVCSSRPFSNLPADSFGRMHLTYVGLLQSREHQALEDAAMFLDAKPLFLATHRNYSGAGVSSFMGGLYSSTPFPPMEAQVTLSDASLRPTAVAQEENYISQDALSWGKWALLEAWTPFRSKVESGATRLSHSVVTQLWPVAQRLDRAVSSGDMLESGELELNLHSYMHLKSSEGYTLFPLDCSGDSAQGRLDSSSSLGLPAGYYLIDLK